MAVHIWDGAGQKGGGVRGVRRVGGEDGGQTEIGKNNRIFWADNNTNKEL
jgi:hypothetical protein